MYPSVLQYGPMVLTIPLLAFAWLVVDRTPPQSKPPAPAVASKDEDDTEPATSQVRNPFSVPIFKQPDEMESTSVTSPLLAMATVESHSAAPADVQSAEPALAEIAASMQLTGTVITEVRRVAILDGRLCTEGKPVTEGSDICLSEVRADHVILKRGDESEIVRYSSPTPQAKPSGTTNEVLP